MCNPTKQPPRRDMYELTTELGTRKVPSFLPAKPKPPRIGTLEWVTTRGEHAVAVFNGAYGPNGEDIDVAEEPWTVIKPNGDWEYFDTHAEALAYAFKETA